MWRQPFLQSSEALDDIQGRKDPNQCQKLKHLDAHIDNWLENLGKYGSKLDALRKQLYAMALAIIPTELDDNVFLKTNIQTCKDIFKYCLKIRRLTKSQGASTPMSPLTETPSADAAAVAGPAGPSVQKIYDTIYGIRSRDLSLKAGAGCFHCRSGDRRQDA